MKYIIKKNGDVLVFSEGITHSTLATKEEVASAGFFFINQHNEYIADGDSLTLGIGAREHDGELIRTHLRLRPMGL